MLDYVFEWYGKVGRRDVSADVTAGSSTWSGCVRVQWGRNLVGRRIKKREGMFRVGRVALIHQRRFEFKAVVGQSK